MKTNRIQVGDEISVTIRKLTIGNDGKLYITIEENWFSNKPFLLVNKDCFIFDFINKCAKISKNDIDTKCFTIGDKINAKVIKTKVSTYFEDSMGCAALHVKIEGEMFDNKPSLHISDGFFVWEHADRSITISEEDMKKV